MNFLSSFFILFFFLLSAAAYPQELDITPYLKKIEAGEKAEAASKLNILKTQYPNSSALLYLEGLLTEDGDKAFQIYKSLVDKYPYSKYADDAIYRIYNYLYAIDNYDNANHYLNRLKTEYSESPYIRLTEKVVFSTGSKTLVKPVESKTEHKVKEKADQVDYKYTIQAGAFTRKENAIKLKADLDKAGYTSELVEKSVGGSLFHVVYVGKFADDEEAKNFLGLINSKFKLQGWVVKL